MSQTSPARGLLDAHSFLAFADRLRALRDGLEGSGLAARQRDRLQARLAGIAAAAADDLDGAHTALEGLEIEVGRLLR